MKQATRSKPAARNARKSAALTKRPSRKLEGPFTISLVWDRLTQEQQQTVTGLAASMAVSSGDMAPAAPEIAAHEQAVALEAAGDVFNEIAGIAASLKRLAQESLEDETGACAVAVVALAEKIGYMSDAATRHITKTDIGGVYGEYLGWIGREDQFDLAKLAGAA